MTANAASSADNNTNAKETLTFHYIKSNQFRVIHVDGMIGTFTPSSEGIEMVLFSERQPIPLQVTYEFEDDGSATEVSRVGREGVTREVDVNAIMSVDTAEQIGKWLLEQVAFARRSDFDQEDDE